MNTGNFFAELKRRNVYKVAVAYAVVGWLLVQVTTQVFPIFEIPNWALRLIVLAIIIGFPIALVIAWAFELTPEGIKRTEEADAMAPAVSGHKKHAWIYIVVVGALVSIGLFFLGRYTAASRTESSANNLAEKSIAVLPFDNQNSDPDTDYLCDGIPESVINSLSQLPKLKVMSRNSVFHYKGKEIDPQTVAKELKVGTILTGRVAQRGDGLMVNVELIDGQDNSQMWGQQYNRKLADVFALQEEIAKEISEKLRLKLTGAEEKQLAKRPTENIKAFQYYMRARSAIHRGARDDMLAAVRFCQDAIAEDPNYALAYTGLADAYAYLGARAYIAPIEGKRKAEEAARKALSLDNSLAEAHAALGQVYIYFTPSNFVLGDQELRRAIELSPSFALAHFFLGLSLVRQGRFDEGLAEFLQARELDRLASDISRGVAVPYYLKRDYAKAFDLLQQAKDLGPPFSHTWEIGAYIKNGKFDEARAGLEQAKRDRKDDPIVIYSTGILLAAQNKRADALDIIKELEAMSGPDLAEAQYIARIYAALNEKEMALTWLERGLATGAIGFFYKDDPMWDPIRDDPRFAVLLGKIVVPETVQTR
jgi:TolB-like protein/Flp pilus assembly protein TadD